jgi:hypothetical protein
MKLYSVLTLLSASLVLAHHGDAGRYEDTVSIVKGTVVEVQLVNPHSMIVMDVEDGGKTTRWQAELAGRTMMLRDFNWSKTTLKTGDKVTLTGRKAKSGAPYMNLTEKANVVLSDSGKELFRTENYGK